MAFNANQVGAFGFFNKKGFQFFRRHAEWHVHNGAGLGFGMSAVKTAAVINGLIKQVGLVQSTAEAVRLIEQGAVKIDGEKITDRYMNLAAGKTYLVQVGKRRIGKIDLR